MFAVKFDLNVEELGARIMPTTKVTIPAPILLHATVQQNHAALQGIGVGTSNAKTSPATGATTYQLTGTAKPADLGPATLTGSISNVGHTANARAQGTLTFTDAKGSITVKLTGLESQPANSTLPKYFRYTIVSSTSYYQHFQQSGTARIDVALNGTFRFII